MFPFCNTYRLYERGEAGICCDIDGVALGPVRLVERVEKSYFVRPAEDIIGALEAAFGVLPEGAGDNLVLKIVGIARSLNDGELTQAMLKALYLRLPEIAAGNLAKMVGVGMRKVNPRCRADMAAADLGQALSKALDVRVRGNVADDVITTNGGVAKAGFDPDQPRDDIGRWSESGGAGGNPSSKMSPNHLFSGQSVRSAPPPGSNKVASETVGPPEGFITPAKRVEFTTMNNEIRIETTGGGIRARRDGKSGTGTVSPYGDVWVWGYVYRDNPATGNKDREKFNYTIITSAGAIKEKNLKLPGSGYVVLYIQGTDNTSSGTKVEIFE